MTAKELITEFHQLIEQVEVGEEVQIRLHLLDQAVQKGPQSPASFTNLPAFKSKYLGVTYKVMLAAIDEIKTSIDLDAVFVVVQSSELSKSKAVYRTAQNCIVIPIYLQAYDFLDTFCEFVF